MNRIPLLCAVLLCSACHLFGPGDSRDKGGDDTEDPGSDTDDTGVGTEDSDPPAWTWTPVLIDFDELSGNIDVSTQYPDVTFSTGEDTRLYAWDYASYARSEPFTAYTARSGGGAGVGSDLTFTFTEPVRALEFYTLGDQTNGSFAWVDVVMEGGATDSVQLVGDGGASSAELCDLTAWEHIVSITIRDMTDPNTVNLDDISFEVRGQ